MPGAAFRLVLVEPRVAGNIGACARLAANFGIRDWVIVTPSRWWEGQEARKYATGTAGAKLDSVRMAATVAEAVEDCHAAIGFTRRRGKSRESSIELGQIPELSAQGQRIALVFGNEETGLTSTELEPCTHRCTLATAAAMPSMNLSHAVAVVLARVYESAASPRPSAPRSAPLAELEGLMSHWRECLIDIGLDKAGNPERILRRLRGIFERSALDRQEIRALRGVLSKAQVKLGTRKRGRRVGEQTKLSGSRHESSR